MLFVNIYKQNLHKNAFLNRFHLTSGDMKKYLGEEVKSPTFWAKMPTVISLLTQ